MKQILIILGLFASVTTFAQSPRIKLNQITKDSLTGSVLISSPTDSGMVYSRDLFISYGADTFLILGGDTLAATSSIISSVLSDGVTITGDGTTGSELTVDTTTVIATKGDLLGKQDQLNGTGFVKATGTTISYDNSTYLTSEVDGSVTNEGSLTVGAGGANDAVVSSNTSGSSDVTISGGTNVTVTESGQTITIASSGGAIPVDTFVTIAGTETITGAKTFTSALTQSGGDVNFDSGTFFVDESADRVGIGTSSPNQLLSVAGDAMLQANQGYMYLSDVGTGNFGIYVRGTGTANELRSHSTGTFTWEISGFEKMRMTSNGEVYIAGTTDQGAYNLQVNGTGVWAAGAYQNGSDRLLKENIQPLNQGLKYINKLNPVQYNYKSTFSRDQSKQLGFIAQDVMVALEDVSDAIVKDNGNYLSMAYQNLIPITVKAIQEQQAIIETQEQKITDLETTIQALITRIENLENK